jgi:hypothetical protein
MVFLRQAGALRSLEQGFDFCAEPARLRNSWEAVTGEFRAEERHLGRRVEENNR